MRTWLLSFVAILCVASVAIGVRAQPGEQQMTQGNILDTNQNLDLAIIGVGFFVVNDGNRFLYTRAGNLSINANGELAVSLQDRGRPLEPAINIPNDYTSISINDDGSVYVQQPGQTNLNQVGQIQLAQFTNPQGLQQVRENLYVNSDASGFTQIATPGQDGLGTIRQNSLEINSQFVQAADQTLTVHF